MDDLSDGQRKDLYWSLLRGIAKTAQDQLCAEDRQHEWGPWERFAIKPDWEGLPCRPVGDGTVENSVIRTAAERKCLNCGKEQRDQ